MPDLRIVDEDLWQAARRRQEEISKQFENVTKGVRAYRAKHMNELRRPAFLFSGLVKCGCCGGNYGIVTRDRYGCLNRSVAAGPATTAARSFGTRSRPAF